MQQAIAVVVPPSVGRTVGGPSSSPCAPSAGSTLLECSPRRDNDTNFATDSETKRERKPESSPDSEPNVSSDGATVFGALANSTRHLTSEALTDADVIE